MAGTHLESDIVEIDNSASNVFNFLSDFNNFKSLMPSSVTNWQSTADTCSFTLSGMATIGMRIVEKSPVERIKINSEGKVPFEFELEVRIISLAENKCSGQLVFDSDMNPMMKMMVEKPLSGFFNILAGKMKNIK